MRLSFFILLFVSISTYAQTGRIVIDFNKDWQFHLYDTTATEETVSSWTTVDLPHDWSIEGSFSEKHPAGVAGGALPGGFGVYRKVFRLPADAKNKNVFIEFDGVYRNSEVFINGFYLGKRPNGYISFHYDLTPYLTADSNVLVVKVRNLPQPDSRWYTGSGIYRNVRLALTNDVAVDHWGTFFTYTTIGNVPGALQLNLTVRNTSKSLQTVRIETAIYGPDGKLVVVNALDGVELKDSLNDLKQHFKIEQPRLWYPDSPNLYKAITKIFAGSQVDEYSTIFGIRHFDYNNNYLNGRPIQIRGVCMHHDLGALGAAVNTRAIERQLEILKAMGCNAIRTAHNPPAPELLELCDKMGFLVMVEAFDMWKKRKNRYDYHLDFDEWHQRDLEDMVKRDRNHPSVTWWSIGNEIREQFDSSGIRLTRELTAIVKKMDATRGVTAALTELDTTKNFMYKAHALDVLGLNYNLGKYDQVAKNWGRYPVMAAETASALATRGHYDMPSDSLRHWPARGERTVSKGNADFTVSAYDHVAAYWGARHEDYWKGVKNNKSIIGIFVWSGFDFLGEPVPYGWPARSSYYGIIDLAGFPKDVYYMYQSEWTKKPVLHIFPHWNWTPGKKVDVWAYYNNADEVELFLNNRSLGIRKKQDQLHVNWTVPFQPGTLKAVSRKNGETVLTKTIKTAGAPARIELIADRDILHAGGKDLSFITVRITDKNGNLVPYADNLVNFEIAGEAKIAAVDNGFQASHEPFKASYRKAYNGLCLVILQATSAKGAIKLTARSRGLVPGTIALKNQ